jgi:cupin superfamily acireductone dioxygenase involved in methionine salvage
MRLFEFENSFADNLTAALRNLLGRSNSKNSTMELSYPALNNIMSNLGYGTVNFKVIDQLVNNNPELQELIQDYNEEHIVLGTEKGSSTSTPTAGSSDIEQMASHAAQDSLK